MRKNRKKKKTQSALWRCNLCLHWHIFFYDLRFGSIPLHAVHWSNKWHSRAVNDRNYRFTFNDCFKDDVSGESSCTYHRRPAIILPSTFDIPSIDFSSLFTYNTIAIEHVQDVAFYDNSRKFIRDVLLTNGMQTSVQRLIFIFIGTAPQICFTRLRQWRQRWRVAFSIHHTNLHRL